jgi:hypothetical protein
MTTIAERVARARSDKIATMIAAASSLGVEFVRATICSCAGASTWLRGTRHCSMPISRSCARA